MLKKSIFATIFMAAMMLVFLPDLSAQALVKTDTTTMQTVEQQFNLDPAKSAKLKQLMLQRQDSTAMVLKDKTLKPAERQLALKKLYENTDRRLDALLTADEKEKFQNLMGGALWEKRRARIQKLETVKENEWENEQNSKGNQPKQ